MIWYCSVEHIHGGFQARCALVSWERHSLCFCSAVSFLCVSCSQRTAYIVSFVYRAPVLETNEFYISVCPPFIRRVCLCLRWSANDGKVDDGTGRRPNFCDIILPRLIVCIVLSILLWPFASPALPATLPGISSPKNSPEGPVNNWDSQKSCTQANYVLVAIFAA